ncbi:Arylesterase like protein [Verticillium longisporum]|uniref:Arylesterase like protein n=1 Tax=Verticillium longisporum TaxID=100787 RepID=A0A8I3A0E0_VERLO|nr:Arylesterase like protein [Verticillium longisporum]KAG7141706.1 Arylesterase like protein [Verticillium longisporum]
MVHRVFSVVLLFFYVTVYLRFLSWQRPQPSTATADNGNGVSVAGDQSKPLPRHQPPFLTRVLLASKLSAIQTVLGQLAWYGSWRDYFYPPEIRPDLVKRYEVRPALQVRIFFPASYDKTSPNPLPTVFTIHGGGFCIGNSIEDDVWNRTFADCHGALVVSLDYAKAPAHAYPGPLHDLEGLYHAVLADESLPINRQQTALLGFSAGGNLAATLCQLESRKAREGKPSAVPRAVIPIYPPLDFSVAVPDKKPSRRYKEGLLPGLRGERRDYVADLAPLFDWAYIPYGHDLRDPLLSPWHAKKEDLPANIFVVAAELDFLASEAWTWATRLAGREPVSGIPGRPEVAKTQELELADERFAWTSEDGGGSKRWLLVPDVLHAFDMHPSSAMVSDAVTLRDGNAKAVKVIRVLGEWLQETVWKGAL